MLKEFKGFISRGNVVDLAVAVVIGAAFGKIVTTFVESVLMPPIGLLLGKVDFSNMFVVLDRSKILPGAPPLSFAQAKQLGVPVVAYGQLLNDVVNFLIVAFAVFIVVKQANRLKGPEPVSAPATKECPFCASAIPIKAKRCPQCTSQL